MADETILDELVNLVLAGKNYRSMDPRLVRNIGARELEKGRGLKEAVKAVRGKLHQAGGAYQEAVIDYGALESALSGLPNTLADPGLQVFCRKVLQQHASTRERLPVIETFFTETLKGVEPVNSVLDLACGLNPLALPWMPFDREVEYRCCDIYGDMVAFINRWFAHINQRGHAEVRDLTQNVPDEPVDLALLLKTIPCLEQIDKQAGSRLLEGIHARWLLVTFPARSLGGRGKGMVKNYKARFLELIGSQPWNVVRENLTGDELVFLLQRKD